MTDFDLQGIGMTSQRTRDRLVARLREQGIDNNEVLACMGAVPRHIFVDHRFVNFIKRYALWNNLIDQDPSDGGFMNARPRLNLSVIIDHTLVYTNSDL